MPPPVFVFLRLRGTLGSEMLRGTDTSGRQPDSPRQLTLTKNYKLRELRAVGVTHFQMLTGRRYSGMHAGAMD